jgi:hypothetical protein
LNDIQCSVANDELIVQTETGDIFSYDVNKPSTLRIQKALFHQKQIIIENCLYGVDLNSNSVNICRLRLWIELLKNAYYSTDENGNRILTTLPNIDINIKTGDSLIHRFGLDANFDLRKTTFKNYLSLVRQYKETSNKQVKADINQSITNIKNEMFASFTTPAGEKLRKVEEQLAGAGQTSLFGKFDNKKFEKLKEEAAIAQQNYEKHKNDPIFSNGLEWRIEFPEVLDEDGNFIGFDIVIANPPYLAARSRSFGDREKNYYAENYTVNEYQVNTYQLFIELGFDLLKSNGYLAYIIPNNLLTLQKVQKTRTFIKNNFGNVIFINSLDKIFADASVDNCFVFAKKCKANTITVGTLLNGDYDTVGTVDSNFFGDKPIFSISMVKYKDAIDAYWKIDQFDPLDRKNLSELKSGVKRYETGKGIPKQTAYDGHNHVFNSTVKLDDSYLPYVEGGDVDRYLLTLKSGYIKYGPNLAAMRKPEYFKGPRILVRQIPRKNTYSIQAAYTDKNIVNDMNTMIIRNIQINPLALLGIINSKLMTLWFLMKFDKFQRRTFPQYRVNELGQFPIPEMSEKMQNSIGALVKTIMQKANQDKDYSEENSKVDELVMTAFGLNDLEKESVRKFEF